jgi:diacylglycerol kinase (ATP)
MAYPFGPLRLLADTTSRGGSLQPALAGLAGLDADVVRTTTREVGDAARRSVAEGWRYLVVVGGDDTLFEVVNVVAGEELVLGVVPTGPACDFARTYGLDRPPDVLAERLVTDAAMDIDIGVVDYVAPDGSPATRRFANVAQAGYGADLVRRQAGSLRRLGRVGALVAAYRAIAAVPRQEAEVKLASTVADGSFVNLVVANGQFYAGGAKIAPRGLPDDGVFNVQIFTGSPSQVFLLTTAIYRGDHLPDPAIREYQSPTASLAPGVPVAVEADGIYVGTTPASFSLLPKALRLKI